MKKKMIVGAIMVISGVMALASYWNASSNKSRPLGLSSRQSASARSEVPLLGPIASGKAHSSLYQKPEGIPYLMTGFYDWSYGKKLHEITKCMEAKTSDPELLAFFRAEIANREHKALLRNNMANILVDQQPPDPNLHELFIEMLQDQAESPLWRNYCIQFLSELLPHSSGPQREQIEQVIADESKGGGNRAATAAIHMAHQENLGRIEIHSDFSDQLRRQLEDPEVQDSVKLSMMAVAGKRRDKNMLPLAREYAKQDKNASLKRAAIGALGLMGDRSDIPVIEAALKHKNPPVVFAAKAALNRLKSK